jgi:DNA-binding transcriptional MerR regulator
MTSNDALWTIDDLNAAASLALAEDYAGAPNGRVRDVPDRRTIRYYTTLGLIDRPGAMRGRTALYGRRHLMQLVAIKRLQARGLSLAEVQARLLGATNASLARLARLPEDGALPNASPAGSDAGSGPAARRFWADTPDPASKETDRSDVENKWEATPVQGVPLADEVILLIPSIRPIEDDDTPAIRAAAAPLIHLLHKRRLLRPRPERRSP